MIFFLCAGASGLNAQTAMGQGSTGIKSKITRSGVLERAANFEEIILKTANAERVDPNILWTIAYLETRFRPLLTSNRNAQGLMQFVPTTAARFNLPDPYRAEPAIRAAARYVKVLSAMFGGRLDSILAAYNSGEGTVSAYLTGRRLIVGQKIINPSAQKTIGGVPPFDETVAYVGRGLKIYRWLIARRTFADAHFQAGFPPAISARVAGVAVFDPELGIINNFKGISSLRLTAAIRPKRPADTVLTNGTGFDQNALPSNEPKTPVEISSEVYYDSRSGHRYLIENGVKTVLAEPGAIVINRDSRQGALPQARSTFVAVMPKE